MLLELFLPLLLLLVLLLLPVVKSPVKRFQLKEEKNKRHALNVKLFFLFDVLNIIFTANVLFN